uniref:BAG domain-containing protein n=1 Tax=Rhabditophanes sp. KR3021 TaxID=114890 RepID=A0AC35UFH6_9BILA
MGNMMKKSIKAKATVKEEADTTNIETPKIVSKVNAVSPTLTKEVVIQKEEVHSAIIEKKDLITNTEEQVSDSISEIGSLGNRDSLSGNNKSDVSWTTEDDKNELEICILICKTTVGQCSELTKTLDPSRKKIVTLTDLILTTITDNDKRIRYTRTYEKMKLFNKIQRKTEDAILKFIDLGNI